MSTAPSQRRDARRRTLRDVGRTVRRADLTIAYVAVVVVTTVVLNLISDADRAKVVAQTSTNLANLRDHPAQSLLASAFVVPQFIGLVLLVPMLVILAYVQRHIGRIGALVVGLSGHVGATLVVMVVLQNGIFRGFVDPSVRHASDVGVSYVCATVAAFATLFVPAGRRWLWTGVLAVWWLLPGALMRTFTDVGHATALLIGGLLAFVAWRVVQTGHLQPPASTSRATSGEEQRA